MISDIPYLLKGLRSNVTSQPGITRTITGDKLHSPTGTGNTHNDRVRTELVILMVPQGLTEWQ